MSVKTVSAQDFAQAYRRRETFDLIDVRTPAEFEAAHIVNSRLLPLDRLNAAAVSADSAPGKPVYIMCRTGNRSRMAAEKLSAAGVADAVVVAGGLQACEKTDLPIQRGRSIMSLERQVRIAAGSLVLLGVLCGFLIQPLFFLVSGFVGAGLVFAGISDTCAMGMLLAKMPWNQRSPAACGTAAPQASPGAQT